AVALLASEARAHVGAVLELHVFGQAVDLYPLDRLLLRPVVLERADPLELVVAGRELRVAAHAHFHRRDTCSPGAIRSRMTVLAVDLVEPRVVLVAELDRLERSGGVGIAGRRGRQTRRAGRPRRVELLGDLELQTRILLLELAQLLGFAHARRRAHAGVLRACRRSPSEAH